MARDVDGIFLDVDKWAAVGEKLDPPFTKTDGWGTTYSQEGGPVLQRKVFNKLFQDLSACLIDINKNGILDWIDTVTYDNSGVVKGSDGNLYQALSSNINEDPISEPTFWKLFTPGISEETLTPDDAAPSVLNATSFKTANTVLTTYASFVDGVEGQRIKVRVTDLFSVLDGTLSKTGMTIPLLVDDEFELTYNGATWKQTGGNIGMGQLVKITPVAIATWIAGTNTTAIAVDLSGYIRKGAVSVDISVRVQQSGVNIVGCGAYEEGLGTPGVYDIFKGEPESSDGRLRGNLSSNVSNDAKIMAFVISIATSTDARLLRYFL